METVSGSVVSSTSVRFGPTALPLQTFDRSCRPSLTRGRGKHQAAVPLLLQARAKAPSSQGVDIQILRNKAAFADLGVKSTYEEIRDKVAGLHLVAGVSVALALSVAFTHVDSAIAREIDLLPTEPEVATISTSKEINLAKQLKAIGAKMYGAFWCSHCFQQKQMFGKEAMKYIEYVECFPEGYRRGVKLAPSCSAANIQGFPTWVIKGQQYSGEQQLEKLAELSELAVAQVTK